MYERPWGAKQCPWPTYPYLFVFDNMNAGKSLIILDSKAIHSTADELSCSVLGWNELPLNECSMFVVRHRFQQKKQHF